MSRDEFIRKSLELNLFYQRIMKEHLFFIETHLPIVATAYITEANILKKTFEELLAESVILSNCIISPDAIKSQELVTTYTLPAEEITSSLTGASLNTNITKAQLKLKGATDIDSTEWLEAAVSNLNKRSKNILEEVNEFQKKIHRLKVQCKLEIMLYPEMLLHIIEETELYMEILKCLIQRELPTKTLCDELNFWNHIMSEHAEFVDGMLDPTEEELKEIAENFAKRFEKLVEECLKTTEKQIVKMSLDATKDIRDFKKAATVGLLECQIKSIIPPLLADHVLREVNHYIRLLNKRI